MFPTVNPHLTVVITAGSGKNVKTLAQALDVGVADDGFVTATNAGDVGGANANAGTKSLTTGFGSEGFVYLLNTGTIDAKGGAGGTAGSPNGGVGETASGTALHTACTMVLDNTGGKIRVGGGGGGGGGDGCFDSGKGSQTDGEGAVGGNGAGNNTAATNGGPAVLEGGAGGNGGTYGATGTVGVEGTGNCEPGEPGTAGSSGGYYLDGASLTTVLVTGTVTGSTTG